MRFSTQAGASGDNRGPNTLITSNFIAYEEFSTVSTLQDQGCSSSCTGGPGVSPWGAAWLNVESWAEATVAKRGDELLPRWNLRGHPLTPQQFTVD